MKKNKITLLNIISSLILQLSSMISGFIIPKLILENFGSDVNGLISSITQFLSYITLLEGGVSGVIMTALYKPLVEKNLKKISSIMSTSKNFFFKIAIIFLIYSGIISILYPSLFNTGFDFKYVMSLIWILSSGMFIQYMYSLNLRNLLNADKKMYIVSFTQTIIIFLNIIISIIIVKIFPNIHLLKLISSSLFIIQPIVYNYYIKRNYYINKEEDINKLLIKNRWSGFGINLAAFIHFSTDITILTIFTNLEMVSIYSVYSLVTNGLKQIVQAVTSSINPTIGQAYAKGNLNELNKKLDLYEFIVILIVFLLFTLAIILITPFIMIYTKNITNTNYYQPILGILMVVSEMLYLLKFPHMHLAYAANKYKEIAPAAFIEALINIIISIVLIKIIGINGIAVGTVIAMLYRLVYHVEFSKKIIHDRNVKKFYFKILLFIILSLMGIFLCYKIPIKLEYSIISWIMCALIYSCILIITYATACKMFFKQEILQLKAYIKKNK